MSAIFGDLENWLERWQWSCAAYMSPLWPLVSTLTFLKAVYS